MNNYTHLSNEQLLIRLKRDDRQAFQAIFKMYWEECYRIAYNKLTSKVLAEEATQNIFISLWERRAIVEIQNLQAYLRTSIKYQVINFIEAKLVTQKHLPHMTAQRKLVDNTIEDVLFHRDLMTALELAMDNLPAKTKNIYQLSRFENLTGKEIANRVGLSEKSVEYHISKALKFLRLELKEFIVSFLLLFSQLFF